MRRDDRHAAHIARRHEGYRGEIVPVHRALHRLERDTARQFSALVCAILLTLAWALVLPYVTQAWVVVARFGFEVLGLPANVANIPHFEWGLFELTVPHFAVSAALPGAVQWSVGLLVTAVLLVISVLVPDRWLPLAYGLRLLAAVQASSQFVFAVAPTGFPYEVGGYTEVLFIANCFLIGITPLVLALTYSPLDFHLPKQILLPLLVMGHLVVFVPLQYMAHAWLLHHGSLLWMPLLFWAFGLTLDVAVVVALYGWGVSWRARPHAAPRSRDARRRDLGFVVLAVGAALAYATPAGAQPYRWSASAGAEVGRYTQGLGDSDSQSLALTHERAWLDRWRLDLGRAARFGDEGFGLGVGYFRHLRRDTIVSLGLSSGTGDVIFPEWRFDAGLRRTGLDDGRLLVDLGYTHTQSKAENSSDGASAGLMWYVKDPWALGLDGRIEIGHPGSAVAHNLGASAHFGLYREFYLSLRGEVGRVAYTLVGPNDALVEYDSRGLRASMTWYVRDDRGVALDATLTDADFFVLRSLGVRVFREW